jgi:hypothetical protein
MNNQGVGGRTPLHPVNPRHGIGIMGQAAQPVNRFRREHDESAIRQNADGPGDAMLIRGNDHLRLNLVKA